MLNSIKAMAAEIALQLDELPRLKMPDPITDKIAFIGSGDSYVAALAAHYLAPDRVACCRPSDVIAAPSVLEDKAACFVSASGRTLANIRAAELAKGKALRTYAITADPSSMLAQVCDHVIRMSYRTAGKTSGTISFTASMLVCAYLASTGVIRYPVGMRLLFNKSSEDAASVNISTSKSATFLGDALLYPVVQYAALKFNEVFGSSAVAHSLEDFCHAPLFGVEEQEPIVIFGTNRDNAGVRLQKTLLDAGFHASYIDCPAEGIKTLLYGTFVVQNMVLNLARNENLKECYFMQDKERLKMSSRLIYGEE